jgi:polyisoprenoid-binding protein YceI
MPTYEVDGDQSTFGFAAKAWGLLWVHGRFTRATGTIIMHDGRFDADGVAEAASVNTGLAPRDLHLRARDYLAVRRYPTIALSLRDAPVLGGATNVQLTIRDTTISIPVILEPLETREHECRIRASGQFDRTPLGMRSPRMGVSRNVRIDLDVVASCTQTS